MITNASILGSTTAGTATGGNIVFSTDTVALTGNDNNTVSNCNIGPVGANLPTKGIYFLGTTTTAANNNSGVVINNNNIFDFFGATVASSGVFISSGNTDCNITNNRLYQTATRTQTTASLHAPIVVSNSSGNNFQVTGNTIGFASAAGTGTYTLTGVANTFKGIHLDCRRHDGFKYSEQRRCRNKPDHRRERDWDQCAVHGPLSSDRLTTTTGNTIGSLTGTGSISDSSSSTSTGDAQGIHNFSFRNSLINNNNIGSITVTNTSTGAISFQAIRTDLRLHRTATVSGNTIGGTTGELDQQYCCRDRFESHRLESPHRY